MILRSGVFLLLMLLCISPPGCDDPTGPPRFDGTYRLRFTVLGGAPGIVDNFADTLVFGLNDRRVTRHHVLLPWTLDTTVVSGDSVFLQVFDPQTDCCPTTAGDGFATFAKIGIYLDTLLGSCSAAGRNLPGPNVEWMQTWLIIDDVRIREYLALPPELRRPCEPL